MNATKIIAAKHEQTITSVLIFLGSSAADPFLLSFPFSSLPSGPPFAGGGTAGAGALIIFSCPEEAILLAAEALHTEPLVFSNAQLGTPIFPF